MGRLLTKEKTRDALIGLALLLAAAALVLYPSASLEGARAGIELCANVIVPSLFPFFVVSTLILDFGLARQLGRALSPIMQPLFRLSGICATPFVLGFIGGYPVGARTAIELYESKQCTKTEAEHMLAFCNNCGPAFIFGVVGAGIYGESRYALLLYLVHLCASICVGILFRFYGTERGTARTAAPRFEAKRASVAFTDAVKGGLQGTLNISAFVLLFSIIIRLLTESGALPALLGLLEQLLAPLSVTSEALRALCIGFLELSSGVWALSGLSSLPGSLSLAAFMLGWAGLSVHCQTLSFLGGSGLSCRSYFLGKLLHGVLSFGFMRVLTALLPLQESVSGHLSEQVETLTLLDGSHALSVSLATSFALFLAFFLFALLAQKKKLEKRRVA